MLQRVKSVALRPQSALVQKILFWPAVVILLFGSALFSQIPAPKSAEHASIANFIDIAEKAGLTAVNIFGGVDTKKYIIETTGTGVAIFDYDNDGWPDVFVDALAAQPISATAGHAVEDPLLRTTLSLRAFWRRGAP